MWHRICCLAFLGLWAFTGIHAAQPFIWREAETADTANFAVKAATASATFITEGKWLSISAENAEDFGDPRELTYKMQVRVAGNYHLWFRLGHESVRMPLHWRMDGGEWQTIKPSDMTTNLVGIDTWFEIGWISPATFDLKEGAHTLDLRIAEPNVQVNNKGEESIRYLSTIDVIALVMGEWTPDNTLRPGQEPESDLDQQAAKQVYQVPAALTAGERATVPLNGLWQITRHDDPNMDIDAYLPVKALPTQPHWHGIKVPGDYMATPGFNLGHRVWYRTKVNVPATAAGRSFILDFLGTNWIASVMVNGQFIEGHKSTAVPWQCDITAAIKPGQVNEIYVGLKSVAYAYAANYKGSTLNSLRNFPRSFWELASMRFIAPISPSSKGDIDGGDSGILNPVNLIVAGGPAHVRDVFVKTTVTNAQHQPTNKVITADITVANPTKAAVTVIVQATAVFEGTQQVEKTLPSATVTLAPGAQQVVTLTAPWPEAKLWWPEDDPANMYRLQTTLVVNGNTTDSYRQRFGFREVKVDGKYIRINGLRRNFWNLLGGFSGDTLEEKLANFHKVGNRFERFSADLGLGENLGHRRFQLDWSDSHGIPGRLSTMVDGMGLTLDLANPVSWENFREHTDQVVRAYRNHPSIITYSLENEVLLVGRHGFGRMMDRLEEEEVRMQEIAHQLDPTRPVMMDGSGALKTQKLDICNTHYAEDGYHPDVSYGLDTIVSADRWVWDMQRPYCAGEIAYYAGNPAEFTDIKGDMAADGSGNARDSFGRYIRNIYERYRWNDVAMTCPWADGENTKEAWIAQSALAVFLKDQNATLFGGEKMIRGGKVFNDTFSTAPLTFTWTLTVDGKTVATQTQQYTIEPGFGQLVTLTGDVPAVTVRTPATLTLEVTQPGNPQALPFKDVRELAIFPRVTNLALTRPVFLFGGDAALTAQLTAMGLTVNAVKDLTKIPDPKGILLIAPYALPEKNAAEPALFAFARGGGRVICLEQDNPVEGKGQLKNALPVAKDTGWGTRIDPNVARVMSPSTKTTLAKSVSANLTFGMGTGTGILTGLTDSDLYTWAGAEPTAWRIWEKRWGEVHPWIDCGPHLKYTTLVEIPRGDGILYAAQMRIGGKLSIEPAAQALLANMLRACDNYQAPQAEVLLLAKGQDEYNMTAQNLGCNTRIVYTLEEGLETTGKSVLLVRANQTNLNSLYRLRADVETYTKGGGWIMLWGLEPDGLNAFNQVLGTKHLLREYRMEQTRVTKDPLSAGLRTADITQYTDLILAKWMATNWSSWNVFTYCVDTDDIAPFCFGPPNPNYRPGLSGAPESMTNGFTSLDFWRLIYQFGSNGGDAYTFRLPVACNIERVKVWNNSAYNSIKDLSIKLDGEKAATMELPDAGGKANEVSLNGKPAKAVTLTIDTIRWHKKGTNLVGIDNVEIIRRQPDWYKDRVFPLVANGALVRYPRGEGGFLLNQLKLTEEDLRDNQMKKQRILTTLLQNLGASFTGAKAAGGGDDPEDPEGPEG